MPESWDPEGGEGSNLLWKRDDIGGPCTPVVMNDRLYTIQRAESGTPREGERLMCLDAKTGETLWEHRYNVWLSDVPAERVGWSSPVADPETGNVYVLGSCDIFMCLSGETGKLIWQRPLHEQFGMLSTWRPHQLPRVHEDLVIISGIIINWGERCQTESSADRDGQANRPSDLVQRNPRPAVRHHLLGSQPGHDRRSTTAGDGHRRRCDLGLSAANRQAAVELRICRCAGSLPHRWSSAIASLPATVKKTSAISTT